MAAPEELDIPMPRMTPSYRVSRREQMDPATRRLAIFAGVIGGALLLLVAVWGVAGHRQAGVPVIQADSRPLKVKPDNPGGLQVGGENDEILSGTSSGKDGLAPAPEVPDPAALKAEEEQPATPAAAAPPQVATSPAAPAPTAPPPVATPKQAATRVTQARPRTEPAHKLTPPARPAAAAIAQAAAPVSSRALVQLAALPTEQAAFTEWRRLEHRMPQVLGGHQPTIQKFERDGRTIFRLRTGGFADMAQATTFCEAVRAKGGGCAIAAF